jgi:hypothetical protein
MLAVGMALTAYCVLFLIAVLMYVALATDNTTSDSGWQLTRAELPDWFVAAGFAGAAGIVWLVGFRLWRRDM